MTAADVVATPESTKLTTPDANTKLLEAQREIISRKRLKPFTKRTDRHGLMQFGGHMSIHFRHRVPGLPGHRHGLADPGHVPAWRHAGTSVRADARNQPRDRLPDAVAQRNRTLDHGNSGRLDANLLPLRPHRASHSCSGVRPGPRVRAAEPIILDRLHLLCHRHPSVDQKSRLDLPAMPWAASAPSTASSCRKTSYRRSSLRRVSFWRSTLASPSSASP